MSNATMHPLVEEMLQAQASRDLSQAELAYAVGVAPPTIVAWKNGVTPWPKHRRAIRKWLRNGDESE
jgi:DNA-binding XRE family transcriptional regulator